MGAKNLSHAEMASRMAATVLRDLTGPAEARETMTTERVVVTEARGRNLENPTEDAGTAEDLVGAPLMPPEGSLPLLLAPSMVRETDRGLAFVPVSPRYRSGLQYEALLAISEDLVRMRELLQQMGNLRTVHGRHWSDDWWALADMKGLVESRRRQKNDFRSAVARGDVTRRRRLHLLRRVGNV